MGVGVGAGGERGQRRAGRRGRAASARSCTREVLALALNAIVAQGGRAPQRSPHAIKPAAISAAWWIHHAGRGVRVRIVLDARSQLSIEGDSEQKAKRQTVDDFWKNDRENFGEPRPELF